MAEDDYLGDAERVEEVGASIPSAILAQSTSPAVAPTQPVAQSNSTRSEETQVAQDDARELEELAAVSTGPVYSAFSTGQKRFIVLMVSTLQLPVLVFSGCIFEFPGLTRKFLVKNWSFCQSCKERLGEYCHIQ